MKYTDNEICDIVRHVATKNNVRGLDPILVEWCQESDFIIKLSPASAKRWGTRPEGRKMLATRIAKDQQAVSALLK